MDPNITEQMKAIKSDISEYEEGKQTHKKVKMMNRTPKDLTQEFTEISTNP